MIKKRIKLLTAMVAIVLVVAAVTATDAKYVGEKAIFFDMNLEIPYSSAIHEAIRAKIDGKTICEQLIYETNCAEVSYYYKNSGNWVIKMTTKANGVVDGTVFNRCMDPYINLDFSESRIRALGGFEISGDTYYSLDTSQIKYAVISYYIPSTEIPERAPYNTVDYSVNDFNHLRVYTATSVNDETQGGRYGALRFIKFADCFTATEAAAGTGGKWVTQIVDLEAVNMRGISMNGTPAGSSNGIANWDEIFTGLRLDLGQIGSSEAWFNETTKHDCPAGKTIYIRNLMFFNSYYGAVRAKNSLHASNSSLDPTTLAYTSPIEVEDSAIIPVTTLSSQDTYVRVSNPAEDTVADIFF